MNYCLTKDCPNGYAYFERPGGRLVRFDGHGSLRLVIYNSFALLNILLLIS